MKRLLVAASIILVTFTVLEATRGFGLFTRSLFRAGKRRALTTWKRVGLEAIGLHEARQTAASFYIAAGLNVKELLTCLGHASVTITVDRYGHLLPGPEDEATKRLDAYFALSGGL